MHESGTLNPKLGSFWGGSRVTAGWRSSGQPVEDLRVWVLGIRGYCLLKNPPPQKKKASL